MRILFLTIYYKPDNAATGILMAELAEELALHGHDVRVITSMPHYSTNSIWPEYKGKWSKRERQGEILVHRVWSYVPVHKDRLLPASSATSRLRFCPRLPACSCRGRMSLSLRRRRRR